MAKAALTIEPMQRWSRRQARTVAAALVVLLVGALSATCVLQAQMSAAERACCAMMSSECGSAMAQQHQCCRTTSVRSDPPLAASPRLDLTTPALTLLAIVESTNHDAVLSGPTRQQASDVSPPGSTHPIYLVLSVFRI